MIIQTEPLVSFFGDGAGAVLFEPNYEGLGVQDEYLRSDGTGREYLKIEAGGSILPTTIETLQEGKNNLYQDGKTVSNMQSLVWLM